MRRNLLLAACAAALLLSCVKEETSSPVRVSDTVYTIEAGFAEPESPADPTRTILTLDDATAKASVLWTAGDKFKMFGPSDDGRIYVATYSTTQSGPSVSFSTSSSVGTPCYSIYPDSRVKGIGTVNGERVLIAGVPSQQTAVPGGIQNGLNISVAYSTSQTANLTFHNILSFIRFRLSGDAVSSVKSVTFDAGTTVAGDITISGMASGALNPNYGANWANPMEERASKIVLSGDFVAGQDYLIALAPCTVNGFNMIFKDAENRTIRRHSSSTMTFQRSCVQDFGTISIGDAFPSEDTGEGMIQYMKATSGDRPVDICVISEGFRTEELPLFVELAQSAADFLFDVEPFKTYKNYFNVYFMKVPSQESGASVTDGNGNILTARDTYFGARWGESSYNDMEADESTVYGYVTEHCPEIQAGTHRIDEVPILMIINDTRYGGINHVYSNGRSYCMAPYTYSGGGIGWGYPELVPNDDLGPEGGAHSRTSADTADIGTSYGDWRNTMLHEFGGHCFGRLKDEYWYDSYKAAGAISTQTWPVPFGMNVTGDRDNPTWKAELLDIRDELVAQDPHYGRIGVFQGADVSLFNRWRSEKISCMIDNRRYFSAWQRIIIVKRILQLAGETYSAEAFFAADKTDDPIRDGSSSPVIGHTGVDEPPIMPPLPPPVLHED